jgi:hypothetical protein
MQAFLPDWAGKESDAHADTGPVAGMSASADTGMSASAYIYIYIYI